MNWEKILDKDNNFDDKTRLFYIDKNKGFGVSYEENGIWQVMFSSSKDIPTEEEWKELYNKVKDMKKELEEK